MRKSFLLVLVIYYPLILFCQEYDKNKVDSILKEGFYLYKSEAASWAATDLLFRDEKDIQKDVRGYLSYITGDTVKTIFINGDTIPQIILTYYFDTTMKVSLYKKDIIQRSLNDLESRLISLRTDALDRINGDKTGFYRVYPKTSLNLIPLIGTNIGKVIVITGTQEDGVVPFGNDYVLYYRKDGLFLNQEKIHMSYVPTPTEYIKNTKILQAVHSHVLSDFISSTDICSVLLYSRFIKWNKLVVIGRKYTSIWNLNTNSLTILTTDEFSKSK
jgi:hypothetical protein